jgi:hypothetical protein
MSKKQGNIRGSRKSEMHNIKSRQGRKNKKTLIIDQIKKTGRC